MSKASKFRTVCVYIIGTELMERLAYYSLAYNLVLFFTRELKISTDIADSITTLFSALVMVFALLGGYVSDVYLGRYRTILWFSSLYLVAIGCCAVAAAPPVRSAPFALVSLFFIAGWFSPPWLPVHFRSPFFSATLVETPLNPG